jgi:DNA-binding transcriptional ArsR family regulator
VEHVKSARWHVEFAFIPVLLSKTVLVQSGTMSETAAAAVPLDLYVRAIGDATRWNILAVLAEGEPQLVMELAARVGRDQSTVSKHLALLREAGMVEQGRARLYRIPPRWVKDAENRVMDFGHGAIQFRRPGS